MKKLDYNLDSLLDIRKFDDVFNTIKVNSKHREKIATYEMFKTANFSRLYEIIESKEYKHSNYNIFLINEPKARIIMSENMTDKIINHLISKYILTPLIEPKLLDINVATRKGKGSSKAIFFMKKYINKIKENSDKIYVLKCDINKFFYSIDHEILYEKLRRIIVDKEVLSFVKEIIDSTDQDYINIQIDKVIEKQKRIFNKYDFSEKEKQLKFLELDKIPKYRKGKGLPIGNMTSQIMAIFYLNDLDYFIKNNLSIKYYVRYMDDLILIHTDKEYLRYCLGEIKKKVSELELKLNRKTQIYELHNGVCFLGYKFKLKNKKLLMLLNNQTKRRIKRKKKHNRSTEVIKNYNGYLKIADCGSFTHSLTNKGMV